MTMKKKGEYVCFLAVLHKMEFILDLTLKKQVKGVELYSLAIKARDYRDKINSNDFKEGLISTIDFNSRPYGKLELSWDAELYKTIFRDRINVMEAVIFKDQDARYSARAMQHALKLVLDYSNAQMSLIKKCKEELHTRMHHCSNVGVRFLDLYEQYSVAEFSSISSRKSFGTVLDNVAIWMPLKLLEMVELHLKNECVLANIVITDETEKPRFNDVAELEPEPSNEKIELSGALTIQLCDSKAANNCLDRLSGVNRKVPEHIKSSLQNLIAQNGKVNGVALEDNYSDKIKLLYEQFPHLSGLFEMIESHLDLLSLGDGEKQLSLLPSPIILDGSPGTGKTMAAEAIAKLFHTGYEIIGGAELTNPFDITGMSASWSSAKPGIISRILIEEQKVSPVVVLDEIDKMGDRGDNMSPHNALYTLFEAESAKRFKDEYFAFECDASHINWICTSNDLGKIPSPIKDRSQVINVPIPTLDQRITIVQHVYRNMQLENKWGEYFAETLDESLAHQIATLSQDSIRMMKHLVMKCFTQIAKENKAKDIEGGLEFHKQAISIAVANLNGMAKTNHQRIGFI